LKRGFRTDTDLKTFGARHAAWKESLWHRNKWVNCIRFLMRWVLWWRSPFGVLW